jgi:hypothetical protein
MFIRREPDGTPHEYCLLTDFPEADTCWVIKNRIAVGIYYNDFVVYRYGLLVLHGPKAILRMGSIKRRC